MSAGAWVVLLAAALLGARLLDAYTIGFVSSGSMEPTLPKGSLFIALRQEPGLGDVVVFQVPTGERVVHRVVGVTPAGLLTQGDANQETDQANGLAHPDPQAVQVVPTIGGVPVAIKTTWLQPSAVVAAQVALLAFGLRTFTRNGAAGWASRVRPHHFILAAAGLLVLTSPLYVDQVDAAGRIGLQGALVPTTAYVQMANGTSTIVHLPPLDEVAVGATGPVTVVHAPALPGVAMLAPWGPTAAILPSVMMLLGLAWIMRGA